LHATLNPLRRALCAAQSGGTYILKALLSGLNTLLGIWFLSTVVVGIFLFLFSERTACVAAQQHDFVEDIENTNELEEMFDQFLRLERKAQTTSDLSAAMQQLGPSRLRYLFSSAKDKSLFELSQEHVIVVNRWCSRTFPSYWLQPIYDDLYSLQSDTNTLLSSDDSSAESIKLLKK
jgi:hypothetical protein